MRYLDAAGVRQLKELNDAAYVGKEEYNDDTMVISAALNDLNSRVTTAESEIAGFSGGDENIIETVKVNGTALTVTDKAVDVTVPTTLASLTDDSTHRLVTDTEKTKLQGIAAGAEVNVQSDWSVTDSTSDAYIANKPTIPTKVSDLTNDSGFTTNTGTITGITMNGVSKGTSGVVDLGTVITDVSGKADASVAIGTLSLAIDNTNYQITLSGTKVDGTTFTVSNVIDLPLESVVVNGSYNNTTKKVVLTLQNGNTVDFSVADLVAGLQSEITSTNKLSADLISDGTTNKVVTATEKSTWNGKEDTSNKVTSISSSSTDVQYPSAKCMYDEIADAAYIGEPQGSTTYTSGGAVVDLSNYVQTSNIKTINNQSILGSGNLTITGETGTDGVGISSVVQTTESTESGGTNVITVTKSDGTSSTFNVRNGDAVGSATIVQTKGNSTTAVMSQDAVTRELAELDRRAPESFGPGTWTEYTNGSYSGMIPGAMGKLSVMVDFLNGMNQETQEKEFRITDASGSNYFALNFKKNALNLMSSVNGTSYQTNRMLYSQAIQIIVAFDLTTGAFSIYGNGLLLDSGTYTAAQIPDYTVLTKCKITDAQAEGRKYWAVFNNTLSATEVQEIFALYPQTPLPSKLEADSFDNLVNVELSTARTDGTNVIYSDRTATSIKITTNGASAARSYVIKDDWIDVADAKTHINEYKMHLKVNSGAVTVKGLGSNQNESSLYVYDSDSNLLGDRDGAGVLSAGEYDLYYYGLVSSAWNNLHTRYLLYFSTSESSEFILSNVTRQRIGAVLMFGPQNYRGNYWLMPGGSKIPLGSDLVVNYDVYKPNITTAQNPQFNGQLKMDSGKIYMGYLTQLVPGVWKQINNS